MRYLPVPKSVPRSRVGARSQLSVRCNHCLLKMPSFALVSRWFSELPPKQGYCMTLAARRVSLPQPLSPSLPSALTGSRLSDFLSGLGADTGSSTQRSRGSAAGFAVSPGGPGARRGGAGRASWPQAACWLRAREHLGNTASCLSRRSPGGP